MAEGRYRHFNPLEKFPANWPDAVAAFMAPLSNLNLAAKSTTTVMAPVDTQPQLSLGVDGLWRFSGVEIDAAVPAGAAQTFDVVATTTANVFKPPSKEGEGESDETNYAFALQVVTHNTLPSGGGIAAAQKVGEVDWDGAKITGLRQLVGQLRATDPVSPAMPITSVPAITATGIAAATAPVVRWSAPEASNVILELLQGAAAKLKVTAGGQIEWTGGGPIVHGEGSALVIAGKLTVSESVALNGGGTTTTPAVDDNTTKIATTAYVIGQAGAANPIVDGAAAPGVSTRWARQDHVHPTDASRAPAAGSAAIVTVGKVTAGTWEGTPIATAFIANEAITAGKLANESVETAKIKNEAVTGAKLAKGAGGAVSGLTIAGNYTNFVERATETNYEPSATRPTFVILTGQVGVAGPYTGITASVNGKEIGSSVSVSRETVGGEATLSFIVPAGQVWRARGFGLATLYSSYLTL